MTVTVVGDILGSGPVEQQFVTQAPIHGLDSRLVERGDQGAQRIVRRSIVRAMLVARTAVTFLDVSCAC
jgi:hypothetical protein